MKQILITLLLSVLTLFISLLLFINNYFKADEEYYILHNEKISLICLKSKKNFCKKCNIKDCETILIDNYSLTKEEKEALDKALEG